MPHGGRAGAADSLFRGPRTAGSIAPNRRYRQHRLPNRTYDDRMNQPLTVHRVHGAETKVSPTLRQPLRILQTSSQLPSHADVVVIGAGIIGVFAAYYMARRGLSVAVVEKGHVGAEQSSRNWGWCRQQN